MKNLLQHLRRVIRQDKATPTLYAFGFEPAPQAIRVTSADGTDIWAHINEQGEMWLEKIDWNAYRDEEDAAQRKI